MTRWGRYEHHGNKVWVQTNLKGKHRHHCLCYSCDKFKPDIREENCPIANRVFQLCLEERLVLPVWECPEFGEEKI